MQSLMNVVFSSPTSFFARDFLMHAVRLACLAAASLSAAVAGVALAAAGGAEAGAAGAVVAAAVLCGVAVSDHRGESSRQSVAVGSKARIYRE